VNGQNVSKNGQCLTDDTLTDYLEGSLEPVMRAAAEVHLIGCESCRASLALFMRILRTTSDPEEDAALQSIEDQFTRQSRPPVSVKKTISFGTLLLSLAAVAVLIVLGVVSASFLGGDSADEINLKLLSKARLFDARLVGQAYHPLTRGTEGISPRVIADEALVREVEETSQNPHTRGVVHLMNRNSAAAIRYLEEAAMEPGATAKVNNDLGVAYLSRGGSGDAVEAGKQFQAALGKDAKLKEAVFNLAVVYEATGDNAKAEAQWQRYLSIDSDSEWAEEARTRQKLSR
jgi:tetratricopeptide (TPR) repeat protein